MTYLPVSSAVVLDSPYRLDSLAAAPAPRGCEGTWQSYVISQGDNTIVGMRAGTTSEVAVVLSHYIERLNERFAKQQSRSRK